ncbi:MAG TPA: hypothetical protein VFM68_02840 [Candidatus Saccharimonadales bacterium]|nr:hypothetical protein [Candidatus Saccharimonadales bacterium]
MESEAVYHPIPSFAGKSTIQLAFQPSDNLEQSIQQFVKPDMRGKHRVHFNSDPIMQLRYTGGDSNGIKYLNVPDKRGEPSDEELLYAYTQRIETIQNQNIPVAAYHPRLERLENGDLSIQLALLPSEQTKRRIGDTILRHIGRDEVIYARTAISYGKLGDDETLQTAQEAMIERLAVPKPSADEDYLKPSPIARRMYVTDTYVTSHPNR